MNEVSRWMSAIVAVMCSCVLSGCAVKTNSNWVGCVIRDGEIAVVAPQELRLRPEAIEVLKQVKPEPWQQLPVDISFATNQSVVVSRASGSTGGSITIQSGDLKNRFGSLDIGAAKFQAIDAGVVVGEDLPGTFREHLAYGSSRVSARSARIHRVVNGEIAPSGIAIGIECDQLLTINCFGAVLRRKRDVLWVDFSDMQAHIITSLPDSVPENCVCSAALSTDGRSFCIMFHTNTDRMMGSRGSVFVYGSAAQGECFLVEEGVFEPIAASPTRVLADIDAKLIVSRGRRRAMIAGFTSAVGVMSNKLDNIELDWFSQIDSGFRRYISPDGLLFSQTFYLWGKELVVFEDSSWSDYSMYSRLDNVPEFFVPRSWCEAMPSQSPRTEP